MRLCCTVGDCDRTRWAQGLCSKHYRTALRASKLTPPESRRPEAVTAAAGAMREAWLQGVAEARSAGRDPVTLPDAVWPILADAALTAATPLLRKG